MYGATTTHGLLDLTARVTPDMWNDNKAKLWLANYQTNLVAIRVFYDDRGQPIPEPVRRMLEAGGVEC